MATKKAKVKRAKGGCSGPTLYVVNAGGRLTATRSKARAKKLQRQCWKKMKGTRKRSVCTYSRMKSPKMGKRRRRR